MQAPAADLVPPGTTYDDALGAFTCWKILGDRLGYNWRVNTEAMRDRELLLHYDQPTVHLAMKSPKLTDRFVTLDFERHALVFLEQHHQGIDEANYRAKWADHLRQQGFTDDVEGLVARLEDYYLDMASPQERAAVHEAMAQGRSPYLALRVLGETRREVRVPGEWLTEWKRIPWPSLEESVLGQ